MKLAERLKEASRWPAATGSRSFGFELGFGPLVGVVGFDKERGIDELSMLTESEGREPAG